MSSEVSKPVNIVAKPRPRTSEFNRFRKVFFSRGVVVFGLVIFIAFLLMAIFAPWMAPYDPYETNLKARLLSPQAGHWLGTDELGRDTLSRLIYGSRISLMIGVIVVLAAATIGMCLGLVAGYVGGWAYAVIMRCTDALMAFPMILLALVVASLLGGGIKNIIIALTIGLIPTYVRLMCGQVLTVKENDYILAGRATGVSNARIMAVHLFPNCFPPIIVVMAMMLGGAMLAEAGLSFLGIGIEAPLAAWGSMANAGRAYLTTHPILCFAPGIAIMLVVFSINMVGDGLRDALDPRLRGLL